MKQNVEIMIIGGGVIGASIFYHLSRAGYYPALLEKTTIASGCTAWSGGISRSFHLDSIMSDRAALGWQYYRNFQNMTGEACDFHQSGFITIPKQNTYAAALAETKRLAQTLHIEWLTKPELRSRFGYLFNQMPDVAVYEPKAGYLNPKTVAQAWIRAGKKLGGDVYEHTSANTISLLSNKTIQIETSRGKILAKKMIIAAGAETPTLLNKLGHAHHLFVKNIQMDLRRPLTHCMSHPAYLDEETQLYGRHDAKANAMFIGLPIHHPTLNTQHSDSIYQTGLQRFSWVKNSELIANHSHPDAYTADGRGAICALTTEHRIFLASGFSGGGFKMAPWAGLTMAELISKAE